MRARPHVSGCFRKQRSFLSFSLQPPTHKLPSVWHQKRKFTKTFPRVKIFENATLTCGRTNTEDFQPRSHGLLIFKYGGYENTQIHVIHHILTTSITQYLEGMLSYFHCFSAFKPGRAKKTQTRYVSTRTFLKTEKIVPKISDHM